MIRQLRKALTGPISLLRWGLTCAWVIFCILIVVVQWQLIALRSHCIIWHSATTRWLRRGVVQYESLQPSVLSRSAGLLAGRRGASMRPEWLLISCLSKALLLLFIGG